VNINKIKLTINIMKYVVKLHMHAHLTGMPRMCL